MIKFLKIIIVVLLIAHVWFNGYSKGFDVGYYIGTFDGIFGKVTYKDLINE